MDDPLCVMPGYCSRVCYREELLGELKGLPGSTLVHAPKAAVDYFVRANLVGWDNGHPEASSDAMPDWLYPTFD